jgi:alkylation response protein AidB-like acyl-CoA dehydrogenase
LAPRTPAPVRPSIFTDEHEALRDSLRAFIARELRPHAAGWEDAGWFPDEVFTKLGDAGFLGLTYPVELGGQGGDYLSGLVMKEEMAHCGSGGVSMAVAVQTDMATPPILKFGTKDQHDAYLRPAIQGTKIGCIAITEPGAGSDVASIQTVAKRDGSDWVLNGRKVFITNGVRAHFSTLVARTNKAAGYQGFSLFIIPTDAPGWSVSRKLDKLGMRSSDTAEIALDDVRVPADALLGEEGNGFPQIMWELQGERLVATAGSVAGARALHARCVAYAKERTTFGRPIGRNQAISHRLVAMAEKIEAAQQLIYDAAWSFASGGYPVAEISMAKLYGGIVVNEMTNLAMQIFAGSAYTTALDIERAWRDTRLIRIGGGTDEVMREVIAKTMGL